MPLQARPASASDTPLPCTLCPARQGCGKGLWEPLLRDRDFLSQDDPDIDTSLMSVRELRTALFLRGVDYSHVVEKSEMRRLLREAQTEYKARYGALFAQYHNFYKPHVDAGRRDLVSSVNRLPWKRYVPQNYQNTQAYTARDEHRRWGVLLRTELRAPFDDVRAYLIKHGTDLLNFNPDTQALTVKLIDGQTRLVRKRVPAAGVELIHMAHWTDTPKGALLHVDVALPDGKQLHEARVEDNWHRPKVNTLYMAEDISHASDSANTLMTVCVIVGDKERGAEGGHGMHRWLMENSPFFLEVLTDHIMYGVPGRVGPE